MKKSVLFILLTAAAFVVSAVDYIPLAFAHNLSFEEQNLFAFGEGLIIMKDDDEGSTTRDSFQLVALYTRHNLKQQEQPDYPGSFNSLDFLFQKKKQRYQFFSLLKSYADKPVYGGAETYDFVSGFAWELIQGSRHSFWAGASLAVTDSGTDLPVLPLPFIHYDFSSRLANLSLDFTTSPMMDFVLFPQDQWHLNGSVLITDMGKPLDKGMKYDFSLEYRFFKDGHSLGDFAGVKLGVQAEDYEYSLSSSGGDTQQIAWNSVYGTLDLSLLELTAGYMTGAEQLSGGYGSDLGSGFFCSLQLAWLF